MSRRIPLSPATLIKRFRVRPAQQPFLRTHATKSPFRTTIRTMATSVVVPEGKYEFLVVLPDKPGVREKRFKVREAHFQEAATFREKGTWKTGGALLNGVPKDDKAESLDFFGSAFVVVAESVDKVREQFSQDIYATAGVWDMEKIQIYPFRAVFRDP